jgi:hypothetical protein
MNFVTAEVETKRNLKFVLTIESVEKGHVKIDLNGTLHTLWPKDSLIVTVPE